MVPDDLREGLGHAEAHLSLCFFRGGKDFRDFKGPGLTKAEVGQAITALRELLYPKLAPPPAPAGSEEP
jgi:hypothetical protein